MTSTKGKAPQIDGDSNVLRTIKVEIVEKPSDGETTTDIQNYLKSFNKEIQIIPDRDDVIGKNDDENDSEGTYYITENGQCFYQANSGDLPGSEIVTVIPGKDGSVESTIILDEKNGDHPNQNSDGKNDSGDEDNQMIIGTNSYQTVTIVPSESNPGEVSYVLIVQPNQEEADKDQNGADEEQSLHVYDFDDGEVPSEIITDSCNEETKKKVLRTIQPKKSSQTISQSHMCNYCNYTSPKRYLLSRHMKSHSEERPHKCSVCERGFKTLASLQNHVNTHTGTKPHNCKFCTSNFTTSGELVRHVRYKHTHEKPHKCSVCDYASVELSKMRNHMRCHTGERPYQCPHCTYASPDSFKLKRHLRIHTGERPYECKVCGHRFTQSNSLKAHALIHNEENKPIFRCDMCPATCGRKTDLRIHVQKLHTSGRVFTCRRCGKQFPDRYNFKMHSKTHNGEKCWKCELCPYASISHRHLESHMLVHTDQKPFACGLCEQRFRQKQLLKRHQNLYHNPGYIPPSPKEKTHECSTCKKQFRHKGNLIRHMSIHDPDSQSTQKSVALKLGRQKRIKTLNGQPLQNTSESEAECDEPPIKTLMINKSNLNKSLLEMEGDDGQQYVLLEVIQIPASASTSDNEIDDPLASNGQNTGADSVQGNNSGSTEIKVEKKDLSLQKNVKQEVIDTIDLDNCFGFGESDEEEETTE